MAGRLFTVDGYPGVVESTDISERACGEVYRILRGYLLLPRLDEYEQCSERFAKPHEYVRKRVPVRLAAGGSLTAWAYVYNRDTAKLRPIRSGDFLAHGR